MLSLAALVLAVGGCAVSRDVAGGGVRDSYLSDRPPAGIASCIALGMSWAGLPTEMLSEGERTVVTFRQGPEVFANATITAGEPTVVDLRGAFGARIRRAVVNCL